MQTEIEAKFADVDPNAIREKLKRLGARQLYAEKMMRRKTFDLPGGELYKKKAWVRVRDEGDKVTLSYKQMTGRTLHGTKELTVTVSDFEKTCDFLLAIHLNLKSYQETKREAWEFRGLEITIDTWPWVPPFIEIEAKNEKTLKSVVKDLGLDWKRAMHGSVEPVYQMHYDFTDAEINSWKSITFTSPPKWLLKRKK
ncbi:MAG: CYTH domain-containing protein [Candidatus Taylorbacteria bacterium]